MFRSVNRSDVVVKNETQLDNVKEELDRQREKTDSLFEKITDVEVNLSKDILKVELRLQKLFIATLVSIGTIVLSAVGIVIAVLSRMLF